VNVDVAAPRGEDRAAVGWCWRIVSRIASGCRAGSSYLYERERCRMFLGFLGKGLKLGGGSWT